MTIRVRVILASVIMYAALMGAFSYGVYRSYEHALVATMDARMKAFGEELQAEVEEQMGGKKFLDTTEFRSVKSEGLGLTYVRLLDSTGVTILGDSVLDVLSKKSWTEVSKGADLYEDVQIARAQFRSLWLPIEVGDTPEYALQVVSTCAEVESNLRTLGLLLLFAMPLAFALFGAAISFIVGRGLRPVGSMIRTAQKISTANLGERVPLPKGDDEIKALASTLNSMMDRLEASFVAQKTFAADASHELRTPLAIAQSELDYLKRRVHDRPARSSLAKIGREVDRLKKLTGNLLLLAKLDGAWAEPTMRPISLRDVVQNSLRHLASLSRNKQIRLSVTLHDVPDVHGDADQLETALSNVLENAIKYSHRRAAIEVTLCREGPMAVVRVRDHGRGIAEHELGAVFERFHRGSSARVDRDGSGLGLAIALRIVELHGGSLTAASAPPDGSTFTLKIPLSAVPRRP